MKIVLDHARLLGFRVMAAEKIGAKVGSKAMGSKASGLKRADHKMLGSKIS